MRKADDADAAADLGLVRIDHAAFNAQLDVAGQFDPAAAPAAHMQPAQGRHLAWALIDNLAGGTRGLFIAVHHLAIDGYAMVLLTTDTVLKLNSNPNAKLGDVKVAAQITKNALESKRVSLDVRKKIEAAAREKLLQEQSAKLDKLVKSKGLSEETAADMRKKILGIS